MKNNQILNHKNQYLFASSRILVALLAILNFPFLLSAQLAPDVIYCGNVPASSSGGGSVSDPFGNTYEPYQLYVPVDLRDAPCSCENSTAPFNLVFEDCALNTGIGFDDPTFGLARRAVLCRVFNELAQLITPNLDQCIGSAPTVQVQVQPSHLTNYNGQALPPLGNNIGGVGGPYYYDGGVGLADGLPWIVLNSGRAPQGFSQMYHGLIRINFNSPNFDWHLDPDTPVPANKHDLYTVCLHEALHLLGFVSFLNNGGGPLGNPGGTNGGYTRYDAFLRLGTDQAIVNQPDPSLNWFLNNPPVSSTSLFGSCQTPPSGPGLTFAHGSGGTPAYTGAQANNSAFSHLDADCDPNNASSYVMSSGVPKGVRRALTDEEKNVLCALGYHLNGNGDGCGCAVGGADDTRVGCDGPSYEVPICGTLVIRISDLLANDPNASDIQFLRVLDSGDGTLVPVPGVAGAYTFTPARLGVATLVYVPTGCGGKTGNKTYVHIRVIQTSACAHYCNDQHLNCSDKMGYLFCEEAPGCNQLSACNLICNPSICGTVFTNQLFPISGYALTAPPNINWKIDAPGWIRTHGTPDYQPNNMSISPENGGYCLYGGIPYVAGKSSEGLMNFVSVEKNKPYLFSYHVKAALTNNSVVSQDPSTWSRKMNIKLINGDEMLSNIVIPADFNTPQSLGALTILNDIVIGNTFKRKGKCFNTNHEPHSALWIYVDKDQEYTGFNPLFDKVELVQDDFTAGPDRAVGVCGSTVSLGGRFCMLSKVGIEYEWRIAGSNDLAGRYRVMDGVVTVLSGNVGQNGILSIAPLQTTTYVLHRSIYDLGGLPNDFVLCATSDTVTVAVTATAPNAAFTVAFPTCNMAEFTSSSFPGQLHHWNFGNSATSTHENPTYTYPPVAGTYTVTHTVTNECGVTSTATQQVSINCATACACSAATTFVIGTGPSSVTNLSDRSDIPVIVTDACFVVNGTLNVDRASWEVESSFFRMNEGARIEVRPNCALTINRNTFEGCDAMWYGIREERGSVFASGNTIKDAQYGFHFTNPVFAVTDNNTFDGCYVGIYGTRALKGLGGLRIVLSVSNHFYCTNPLKPPYIGQNPAAYSTLTYAGVWIRNLKGALVNKCDFKEIRNAVLAEGSVITVDNCEVDDLTDVGPRDINLTQNLNNFCIWARDCPQVTATNNEFNGYWYGIYNRNSNLKATDNQLLGYFDTIATNLPGYGIYVADCTNRDVEIEQNNADVSGDGIVLSNSTFMRCLVSQNFANISRPNGYGLRLDNARRGLIRQNIVQHNFGLHYEAGIHLMHSSDFDFVENQLYGGKFGMDMNGGGNNYYRLNRASILSVEPNESATQFGFHALMNWGHYCANITEGFPENQMEQGFWFEGMCFPSPFQCQTIGPASGHGLLLAPDAEIGANGAIGGNLDNAWADSDARHNGTDPFFVLLSQFIYDPGKEPAWSTAAGSNDDVEWFRELLTNDNCPGRCPQLRFPEGEEDDPQQATAPLEDGEVLAAEGGYQNPAYNWMAQQRLYERLRQNPSIMEGDDAVQQFYATATGQPLAQLNDAKVQMDISLWRSAGARSQMRELQQTLAEEVEALCVFYLAEASPSLTATKEAEIAVSLDLWMRFEDYWKTTRRTEAAVLLPSVQTIATPNLCAENERDLDAIYLQHQLWEGERPPQTVLAQIKDIADQCPDQGGFAVFAARAWYRRFEPEARWDGRANCAEERPTSAHRDTPLPKPLMRIMPNPAKELVYITMDAMPDQDHSFILFLATGAKVLELGLVTTITTINISTLPPGLYFYTVQGPGGIAQSGKLNIIR